MLLGWRDGDDARTWAQVRAAQLRAVRSRTLLLLVAHLATVAIVTLALLPAIAPLKVAALAGVLVAVSSGVAWRRWRAADAIATVPLRRRFVAAAMDAMLLALAWTIAASLFAAATDTLTQLTLWTSMAVLMTATTLALAPLLLATLVFLCTLTVGLAAPLISAHAYLPLGSFTALAGLLIVASWSRARGFMALMLAESTVAERDETVSLLLREFEIARADWLWEIDASRRIVHAGQRFADACHLSPAAMNGLPFLQVLAGPTWEGGNFSAGLRKLADKLKQRESFRDLVLPIVIDAEERWWEIAASPRHDAEGVFLGFRGVCSDVTEQRATTDRIHRMARFDTLTGLPNRLNINEALSRALTDAERWRARAAFMMIDLDRFKAVNDTLGHPVGDRLLGRVSERLGQLMSDNELIGRLGGDEFAVVVRDASDPQRVERLARTIIETLSRPYEVDHHTLYIGASVGVATSPRDGRTAETLIRSADLALYRSKDRGGGVFHAYEPQLHADAEERRVLELELRQALEQGQLSLHYQPVVDTGAGQLRGFEALLRWNHPRLGVVAPSKFIAIAEETRLIAPIGEWVARTACAEAARWPGELRIAVNVSPEQLTNPNFVTVIASALAQSRLAPQRLELEVTEGVFMREGMGAARVLEQVLDLGVRLSLDDFGTGYSSLGYLSRTRFSSIKIDRSFVVSAAQGVAEPLAIIRAVVALARSLGMSTIAEGVETETELALVRELGCTNVQGHYFGRAVPVEEARDMIRRSLAKARAA
ncbi:putative bifunctional diguanylate cyclase/phosphodiesterase [Sphingomonas sp. Mn802worker]|uniref:putative bifunctional diguanylate cyclase/phosphodiesterase n=1 Tax=Sphingomonas sp. Mn802worker TaxID=629773 RepID=UPI000687AF2C|nr:EAL domain-containing protein [Sphingomonas sp. Mn802worker]